MELTLSAADGTDLGATSDFVLDLSFGDSGNNFTLACPSLPITYGCIVAVEGTEWAGVVDSSEDSLEGGVSTTTWSGRTVHGVLVGKVLCPPSGQDYLTASGDANDCLRSLVARVGLSGFVEVADGKAGIDCRYTFDRYCDAYSGIRKMLAASGARLMLRREDGRTLMWAEAAESHGDGIDSDLLDFDATRATRPVNHLVCAGTGELAERTVVHLYADRHGNVSQTQTLFGADEVCELYDYSNADRDKLVEDGTKKLKGYQSQGSVDVTVHDGLTLYVGDTVTAANHDTGRTVTATVNKKIVKVSGGVASVSYEVGDAQTGTTGGTGTGMESSSGGGVAYTAGEGISITGGRISAEVTQSKLDAVSKVAAKASSDAQGVANDLAAESERAKAAESSNASAISNEVSRAKAAEQVNTKAIADETARAKAAESDAAALAKWGGVSGKPFETVGRGMAVTDGALGPALGNRMFLSSDGRITVQVGREHQCGCVNLSDATDSDADASSSVAATPKAVKAAYAAATAKVKEASDAIADEASRAAKAEGALSDADAALGSRIDAEAKARADSDQALSEAAAKAYQPKGDYAAKAHTHAAADVTSGVLPVARGGTGNAAGNAATATRLKSARTIALTGAVTGSASFDGSANVTITCEGQGAAASFLAAHPVGSIHTTTAPTDLAATYGGTWEPRPSMEGFVYERTA